MKITRIEKKKHLYLLETDSDQRVYITEDTIVKFMLTKNMTLESELFDKIKDFAQFSRGKNRAIYYLSFKQRTKKEVTDYLKQQEIDENYIPKIIQELEKENWLDDKRYAQAYLNQNLHSGNKGPYLLSQKLKEKGITKDTIKELLEDYDDSQLIERLAEKLQGKFEKKLPLKALKDKITQQIMAKGFSFKQAHSAVTNLNLEEDEELEEELIYKECDKAYRKYSRRYEGYELKQRLTQHLARKGYDFSSINSVLKEYL